MKYQILSTWNQCAPRGYIRQCYCFPCQQDINLETLRNHLSLCLEQLSIRFPYIKRRLCLLTNPMGYLGFMPEELPHITLRVLDQRETFPSTYAELRAQGFPAQAFVGPFADLPYKLAQGQPGVPVFEVHVRVIRGGLLLCNYCHHSVTDGIGVEQLMDSFAELSQLPTRGLLGNPHDIQVDIPQQVITDLSPELMSLGFKELVRLCPEYRYLQSPVGPTQPLMKPGGTPVPLIQKAGRIFVFTAQKLEALKEGILNGKRPPSKFTCLAAITWAHVTKARLSVARRRCKGLSASDPEKVHIMLCVNWRQRAFQDAMMHASGNTIALPVSAINTTTILDVCSTDETKAYQALRTVTNTIESTVHSISDHFIALRTAMIRASPDPRYIGIDLDPRDLSSFVFNTWRHHGAKVQNWGLPGLGHDGAQQDAQSRQGVSPDAIRRLQSEWNMGAGLIFPAGHDHDIFEVLVTLEAEEMVELCADPSWRHLVDRIIG